MALRLGIDTGGTYTDAALLDAADRVVATSKALTTRHDLGQGIRCALEGLPAGELERITLVSLSTTLTTNSVVEGRGAPVCVLLAGYSPEQVRRSGLETLVGEASVVRISGGHDAGGVEHEPLDEVAASQAILAHRDRVSAFAVSGLFGVRNPDHELRLRTLVERLGGKPVACGHELASSLGAPRRAFTVALNARMVPYVEQLIASVRRTLQALGIEATLMIVKGDGTLVSAEAALRHPVGTVLSGPAASVIGACALSGVPDAIVADMGGTTTDIAVVTGGRPALSTDGARIGGWQPMVEAVQVCSVGLGGDSEVRFGAGLDAPAIGPRRVVPLSLLGRQHPEVLPLLERQLADAPSPRQTRFVLRLEHNEAVLDQLSPAERDAWERLAAGPVEMEAAVRRERSLARTLARLERLGLAIYSGFTPSDAAHVLGLSDHWCREAAVLAARLWGRQMRRLYGYGDWAEEDVEAPSRRVLDTVTATVCRALVEAGLHQDERLDIDRAQDLAPLLARLILGGPGAQGPVVQVLFAPHRPVVAVGAPAASHYPEVARRLGVGLRVPPHAAVANAVGAVMGRVSQRARVTITQPVRGVFRLYRPDGPRDFDTLAAAVAGAEALAREQATRLALEAGAERAEVTLERRDNSVDHDIDGFLFVEACITATASGPPRCPPEAGVRLDREARRHTG